MTGFLRHVFAIALHLGGFGLIIVGILDSSFLFMPLGNDLLIVAMTARARDYPHAFYYAAMAAIGSVLGCLVLDLVARKGGEAGLEKLVSKRRLEYVKKRVKEHVAWALAIGSLMPPPFPFTPLVAAASAVDYPRKKMLSVIGVARFVRFLIEACLAMYFGRQVLRLAEAPAVRWFIIAIIVISFGGSGWSIYQWFRRSKQPRPSRA